MYADRFEARSNLEPVDGHLGGDFGAPGELEELFGEQWKIEMFSRDDEWRVAAFLLTRE